MAAVRRVTGRTLRDGPTDQRSGRFLHLPPSRLCRRNGDRGGAVWVPENDGTFTLLTATTDTVSAPTELLSAVCQAPAAITATPSEGPATTLCVVRTDSSLKIASVLQMTHPVGRSTTVCQAVERLLDAVAKVATEFHTQESLRNQTAQIEWRGQLLALADIVGGDPRIGPTTYRIANECRRLLECDRVSVVRMEGPRPRVEAISGVSKIDRRSGAARRLEHLAKLVTVQGTALSSDDASLSDEILDRPRRLHRRDPCSCCLSCADLPSARRPANNRKTCRARRRLDC